MDTEDGQVFVKNLAYFVRTHEKALANALQLQRQAPRNAQTSTSSGVPPTPRSPPMSPYSSSTSIASAISLPYLTFSSPAIKPAKLTVTPHHLFYLLDRFESLGIQVGPMNVRVENIHTESTNYVSFLSQAQSRKSRNADTASIHSISSIKSVMSGMSSLWSTLGLSSNSSAKAEKQKAAFQEDLKYLYSAFTKIPCLRLAPDSKARLIAGFEEFPFDSAVPLFAFKNLSALEIYDVDFRQFYGWDRMADQLRSLTVKRAHVDDPADLLTHIVLDDMDRRRRRSTKVPPSPAQPWPASSPTEQATDAAGSLSASPSPARPDKYGTSSSPKSTPMTRDGSSGSQGTARPRRRNSRSASPSRPVSSRHGAPNVYGRHSTPNIRRSSGSSGSSMHSNTPRGSSSNLLSFSGLPSTKWRFLRHLSLADNGLTSISVTSLAPLANTLQSLDLSSNLFVEIPDSLATLTSLRALNLSNCMIESLHSLARNPLPAITTLNLRANRLSSLAGVERLLSLERLDVRENKLSDPTEMARLTGIPDIQEVYVQRNPFVKTHSGYRVTIFNLFRKTPGYTDDIVIDSTGPGYSERKQLFDRAPEQVTVQVVKPPPEDDIPIVPTVTIPQDNLVKASEQRVEAPSSPPSHRRSQSDYSHGSRRRRKAPRRRLVELSQSEAPPQAPTLSKPHVVADLNPVESSPTNDNVRQHNLTRPEIGIPSSDAPSLLPLTPSFEPPRLPAYAEPPVKSPPDFDVSSELYKRKIEALRHDFGNNWLSAFQGDEFLDQRQRQEGYSSADYTSPVVLRPTAETNRTSSQTIVSTGRTLG